MNILADENIETEIVAALRSAGHVVVDIKETDPGIEDTKVLQMAGEQNAVLLTNDKDFGELIYRDRLFSRGVILLRFAKLDVQERITSLIDVMTEHASELRGAFTVITNNGVRIRK